MRALVFLVVYLLVGAVCGVFCARLAKAKGHNGGTWFIAGLLFSVIALIAIAGMPPRVGGPPDQWSR